MSILLSSSSYPVWISVDRDTFALKDSFKGMTRMEALELCAYYNKEPVTMSIVRELRSRLCGDTPLPFPPVTLGNVPIKCSNDEFIMEYDAGTLQRHFGFFSNYPPGSSDTSKLVRDGVTLKLPRETVAAMLSLGPSKCSDDDLRMFSPTSALTRLEKCSHDITLDALLEVEEELTLCERHYNSELLPVLPPAFCVSHVASWAFKNSLSILSRVLFGDDLPSVFIWCLLNRDKVVKRDAEEIERDYSAALMELYLRCKYNDKHPLICPPSFGWGPSEPWFWPLMESAKSAETVHAALRAFGLNLIPANARRHLRKCMNSPETTELLQSSYDRVSELVFVPDGSYPFGLPRPVWSDEDVDRALTLYDKLRTTA